MLSRKGALLIVSGSLVVLLGAVGNVIVSWNEGSDSIFLFFSDCPGSKCANAERISDLYTLGNHLSALFSLIDSSLVPLAVATLGLGIWSLMHVEGSGDWRCSRWLAILGLTCLALSTIETMGQMLIAQEQIRLGVSPGRDTWILTHWLLRPLFWTSLFGFLTILGGSFLRQKPVNSSEGET
ncbi:hypothetical protein KSF_009670 [Reticulibacter mediterranei]|uniref:Uncharacterized protein n=1 Tax=Reticulibacter mediterranei TaxID=2778369 RepID=A0A8J3IGQ9_9CHLR|nr:hypothetical protein [Reticulibacter mediterranei]GHO90919.1 hypothetical protein KSF_009670 [Reticulibacter mediterranei]